MSKMRYKFVNYTPHTGQQRLHTATLDEVLVVSPIRSGKTYSLIRDIVRAAWNNTTEFGVLCCAPTFLMLDELLERPIVDLISECGLMGAHNYTKHKTTLKNGNLIYYRSMDSFERIRGLNISQAYVDEVCLTSREALDVVKGRLLTTNGQLKMITTPRGTNNFIYEDYIENKTPTVDHISFKLTDNPIITKTAIDRLRESYDPLLARQEIEGEWVNLYEDLVYHAFSNDNIKPTQHNPNLPVYIGLDFNINKNAWIALQRQPDNTIHGIAEGFGCKTTQDVALQMIAKYPEPQGIIVPDATGNNNLQGIAISQIQLLRQAGCQSVQSPRKSNPRRVERYALVNGALHNGLDQHRLILDPVTCKNTIKELQTISFKKGTTIPNDQNNKTGHRSDALGYIINYLDAGRISRRI